MIVRQARPADAASVRRVHALAFARDDGRPAIEPVLWDRLVEVRADIPALDLRGGRRR